MFLSSSYHFWIRSKWVSKCNSYYVHITIFGWASFTHVFNDHHQGHHSRTEIMKADSYENISRRWLDCLWGWGWHDPFICASFRLLKPNNPSGHHTAILPVCKEEVGYTWVHHLVSSYKSAEIFFSAEWFNIKPKYICKKTRHYGNYRLLIFNIQRRAIQSKNEG